MSRPQQVVAPSALAAILNSHPDAMYICDLDGFFVDCNPALETATGHSLTELREMKFDSIVHQDDRKSSWEFFRRAAGGETVRYTRRGQTKSGESLLIDVTKLPLRDEADEIIGVIGIARDVAELTEIIEKSERDSATLSIAGRLAQVAGWQLDVLTGRLNWSTELRELLGIAPDDSPSLADAYRMYAPPQEAEMRAAMEACISSGAPIDLETVVLNADGEQRHVHIRGEAVRNVHGTITRVHGAFSDVTADFTERESRRRVEDLLSTTLNQISDALCFIDREWNFTFVNASFELLVNAPARELLGSSLWRRYPDVWSSTFGQAYRDCMHQSVVTTAHGYNEPFERWLAARVYPTEQGIAVYLRDVSADQVTHAALERSNQELREKAELLDNARDAIFVRDLDNNIRYWNRAAAELYGWGVSREPGSAETKMLYSDPHRFDEATAALMDKGFWTGELQKSIPAGRIVIVDARWQLLLDDADEPYAILAVDTEITAAKQEETKRIQAQRLESLGTLAGGIAHDLNNVLTPMLLSVQLLDESEVDPNRRVLMRSIEAGIRRGAEMIKQVLTFARGVEGEQHAIDVASLVGELETLAKYGLPKNIEIRTGIDDDLWPLVGDSTQVMQVLVNLVTNAQDAMPRGGTLNLRARNVDITPDFAPAANGAEPGRYVVVEVEDTGEGMSDEVASRIFEPFFTTKEVGRGTGLGLATSMSIVRSHGGFVTVYTELGTGTRFRVHLPAGESVQTNVPTSPTPQPVPRGTGEHILIVDDEEWILATVRRILDGNGYETTVAANGREAIDTVEASEQKYDLVLTDMMMPVMDGATTIAYLAEHHPEIAVVAASGLSTNGDLARASHSGPIEFIDKPYTKTELLEAVRRALDARVRPAS